MYQMDLKRVKNASMTADSGSDETSKLCTPNSSRVIERASNICSKGSLSDEDSFSDDDDINVLLA